MKKFSEIYKNINDNIRPIAVKRPEYKKKHVKFTVVIAVILVCVIGAGAVGATFMPIFTKPKWVEDMPGILGNDMALVGELSANIGESFTSGNLEVTLVSVFYSGHDYIASFALRTLDGTALFVSGENETSLISQQRFEEGYLEFDGKKVSFENSIFRIDDGAQPDRAVVEGRIYSPFFDDEPQLSNKQVSLTLKNFCDNLQKSVPADYGYNNLYEMYAASQGGIEYKQHLDGDEKYWVIKAPKEGYCVKNTLTGMIFFEEPSEDAPIVHNPDASNILLDDGRTPPDDEAVFIIPPDGIPEDIYILDNNDKNSEMLKDYTLVASAEIDSPVLCVGEWHFEFNHDFKDTNDEKVFELNQTVSAHGREILLETIKISSMKTTIIGKIPQGEEGDKITAFFTLIMEDGERIFGGHDIWNLENYDPKIIGYECVHAKFIDPEKVASIEMFDGEVIELK